VIPANENRNGRGQTEPLAALVAVTAVCVVVSLYVGTLADVVGESESERAVAESSMESLWRDISENGVFEAGTAIENAVAPGSIPEGYTVAVEVTVVGPSGVERTVGSARLGDETSNATVPADARRVRRPVSVELRPGDIRPGWLVVEVWE